jgi:hypothetical protein
VTLALAAAVAALAFPSPAPARTLEVGPGRQFPALGDVPWNGLTAGDTVRIHWRAEPYREKILISTRGTADAPIRLVGVPDPTGRLPVVDGENATTGPFIAFSYAGTQDRGLLIVGPARGTRWGVKPQYIHIENLEFRNAAPPHEFTDGGGGRRKYGFNAAAVFVERGEHVVVRGCVLTGCGNGLFVASGASEEVQSRDILVEGCRIEGNGNVGRDREHNVYTEAVGVTFQNNHFGPLRPGSRGNNVKDRSAGTVVRYNRIEGGAHLLDLVEPEESARITCADPAFHTTYVYGNVMLNGPKDGVSVVHYGGDNGKTSTYRKGTLFFHHNTVVIRADRGGPGARYRTILFRSDTDDEAVEFHNNIVFRDAATRGGVPTELSLLATAGRLDCGANWVSAGWIPGRSGVKSTGVIGGAENFLRVTGNDPGFTDPASGDFRLRSDSPCRGAARPLPPAVPNPHAATRQYRHPQTSEPRPAGADLGAVGGP